MKVAGDGARASECGVWICGASADTARDGTGRAQSKRDQATKVLFTAATDSLNLGSRRIRAKMTISAGTMSVHVCEFTRQSLFMAQKCG